MHVLRCPKPNPVYNPPARNTQNPKPRGHFTVEDFKKEYEKLMSNISTREIKECLKSSYSEAKFYSDICREELKKLELQKRDVDRRLHIETEVNKKKDAEAARIVKKLWEEAHQTNSNSKNRPGGKKSGLRPDDVKKVWAEAKKLSIQSKHKKRKLMVQKSNLDSKIHLAREAIRFCDKFGAENSKRQFGVTRK